MPIDLCPCGKVEGVWEPRPTEASHPSRLDHHLIELAGRGTEPTGKSGISATLKQMYSSSHLPHPPGNKRGEFVQPEFASQRAVLQVECELPITSFVFLEGNKI